VHHLSRVPPNFRLNPLFILGDRREPRMSVILREVFVLKTTLSLQNSTWAPLFLFQVVSLTPPVLELFTPHLVPPIFFAVKPFVANSDSNAVSLRHPGYSTPILVSFTSLVCGFFTHGPDLAAGRRLPDDSRSGITLFLSIRSLFLTAFSFFVPQPMDISCVPLRDHRPLYFPQRVLFVDLFCFCLGLRPSGLKRLRCYPRSTPSLDINAEEFVREFVSPLSIVSVIFSSFPHAPAFPFPFKIKFSRGFLFCTSLLDVPF